MKALKGTSKLMAMLGVLFCIVFCASARNAEAAPIYLSYSCDGLSSYSPSSVAGLTSISFNCPGAAGSINMITGVASALASAGGYSATEGWSIVGQVGGTAGSRGTMTFADYGITGVSATSGASVSLEIDDWLNPSDVSYGCFSAGGMDGCEPYGASFISASLPVYAGEAIYLAFDMGCATSIYDTTTSCAVSDPLTLTLSPGLTFNSTVPGLLSESAPPAPTPEPSTLLLFGTGLLALGYFRRRSKLTWPEA